MTIDFKPEPCEIGRACRKRLDGRRAHLEEKGDEVQAHIDEAREESDQLPEEGPGEQVVDDDSGEAREGAKETPGQPGSEGQATGNPPSDDRADDD